MVRQEKSMYFLEGYNYQGPKHKNPYPNKMDVLYQREQWELGWLTRFHGETI